MEKERNIESIKRGREILYQRYSTSQKKVFTEENTISLLDITNNTKYLNLYKKGEINIEEIAHKNNKAGLHYEVIILEDNMPLFFLQIVHKNEFIGITFLDDAGRKYLVYHFAEVESLKKLFLEEIWYYQFSDLETDEEDYRIHFVFDQEGNAAYRKYDEINQKTIDYESNQPLDVSGLYEDYPEFGNYENLIQLERNMDFLDEAMKPE